MTQVIAGLDSNGGIEETSSFQAEFQEFSRFAKEAWAHCELGSGRCMNDIT